MRFTEDILRGMGAEGPNIREIALEITRGWERHENFELYEDVLPVLASCAGAASNSAYLEHEPRPGRVRAPFSLTWTRGSPRGATAR